MSPRWREAGRQSAITTCSASYDMGLFHDFLNLAREIHHHANNNALSFEKRIVQKLVS